MNTHLCILYIYDINLISKHGDTTINQCEYNQRLWRIVYRRSWTCDFPDISCSIQLSSEPPSASGDLSMLGFGELKIPIQTAHSVAAEGGRNHEVAFSVG
jgi:hypothetical protein